MPFAFRPSAARALSSAAFIAVIVAGSSGVAAQESTVSPLGSAFDTRLSYELINDLPGNANLLTLIGTVLPELVADRIDSGGVSTGEAARLGSHGSSWTQTRIRLGDVDVTDPDGSGTPFLVPGVDAWQHVNVSGGLMPVWESAPGLAVQLVPRAPATAWTRELSAFAAPSLFAVGSAGGSPPQIQRMNSWLHASGVASGPLVPGRLGLFTTGRATNVTRDDRDKLEPNQAASLTSLFTHLRYTPSARGVVSTVALIERALIPTPALQTVIPIGTHADVSSLVNASWERHTDRGGMRAFGGFAHRDRHSEAIISLPPSQPLIVERFLDGPVPELLYPGPGTSPPGSTRRLDGGARATLGPFDASGITHTATLGVELSRAHAEVGDPIDALIGELVDGTPARVWLYEGWRSPSIWNTTSVAAYAAERVDLSPRLTLDAGLRVERVTGSADGAERGVSWRNVYPRIGLRWQPTASDRYVLFSGVGRYGYALPMRWLAVGDPAAPTAAVHRWLRAPGASLAVPIAPAEIGALVSRVGPGTGDDALSTIDPELQRPYMEEFVLGLEARPATATVIRFSGIARRERHLAGLVNTGVDLASYSTLTVPDNGQGEIDQLLPGYNRDPATFGQDRYLLTNPAESLGDFLGLDLTFQRTTERLFILAGATAGQFESFPAYQGFQATENDRGILGDTFSNPNAFTHALGRQFTERAYNLKISGVYRFPREVRLGVIARYQDGQAFARYVVFDGLNQGSEFARAFFNGGTRFTFTMTLDARLQKTVSWRGGKLDLILDAYNFSHRQAEVEESQVDGPTWRAVTAVQPPLTFHAGIKFTF